MNATDTHPAPLLTRLRVLIPFALAYFLSYLFRVVNAVIAPNLAADLQIGPADLGLLTSAYFVSFAAFQLPLGVLLDRFGPR
ncbi:MAG: MFS transporter, partial [Desulfobacterales bacterium]|nr:MFS transporter [Desulfobacterales bacterium]